MEEVTSSGITSIYMLGVVVEAPKSYSSDRSKTSLNELIKSFSPESFLAWSSNQPSMISSKLRELSPRSSSPRMKSSSSKDGCSSKEIRVFRTQVGDVVDVGSSSAVGETESSSSLVEDDDDVSCNRSSFIRFLSSEYF